MLEQHVTREADAGPEHVGDAAVLWWKRNMTQSEDVGTKARTT